MAAVRIFLLAVSLTAVTQRSIGVRRVECVAEMHHSITYMCVVCKIFVVRKCYRHGDGKPNSPNRLGELRIRQ